MDLNASFKTLQSEYRKNPYPSLIERKKILQAIRVVLQSQAYHLAEAISKDFSHRSQEETLFLVRVTVNRSHHFSGLQPHLPSPASYAARLMRPFPTLADGAERHMSGLSRIAGGGRERCVS